MDMDERFRFSCPGAGRGPTFLEPPWVVLVKKYTKPANIFLKIIHGARSRGYPALRANQISC